MINPLTQYFSAIFRSSSADLINEERFCAPSRTIVAHYQLLVQCIYDCLFNWRYLSLKLHNTCLEFSGLSLTIIIHLAHAKFEKKIILIYLFAEFF